MKKSNEITIEQRIDLEGEQTCPTCGDRFIRHYLDENESPFCDECDKIKKEGE